MFQGIGAIVDGVCSSQYSAATKAPYSLVATSALGVFASLCSLGSAIFLGMNRRSLQAISGGRAPAHAVESFEAFYSEDGADQPPHYDLEDQELSDSAHDGL